MTAPSSFDDRAQSWDADPAKHERAEAVAAALRRRIPLSSAWQALEYGCGTGLLSFALHADLGRITLADNSPGMLAVLDRKIAAAGLTHLHPVDVDLLTAPLPAERYELIYSLMTLHHVADVGRLLRIFHELLRPGGWLAISDLDAEDGSFHGSGFTGHNGFDRGALRAQLAEAGFCGVDFCTAYVIRKTTDQGSRDYPLFLAVATRPG
ncbi:class I SAM-dependent methyltransferase [Accumulibacter sp.]|uniref:class I SAM-dependent DNA methyltransferase n=1 Tax=Accumulibacter sp. TaxID=2053492 RepID=UPI0025E7755A|nr:class I SAM-dependent methyltransferase [Accumulibacter sp.]MCM8594034.1 class I SAM-dependent methyltransferase [Accumulibacter sp.]MDS4048178.1 class I SAM-dependent methyltransferase [Accumulibacter sp.]